MKNNNLKRRNIISFKKRYLIIPFLLLIAIGYAFIHNTFSFKGLMSIHREPFDVHLENISIKDGSKEAITPAIIDSKTKRNLSFEVKFNDPLDYYVFYFDIVNNGKIDAIVSDLVVSGIPDTIKPYIIYSMTYEDDKEIKINDLIEAKTKETIKFIFKFNEAKNLIDIFGSNANIENFDLNIKFDFTEANGSGTLREKGTLILDVLKNKGPVLDNIASDFVDNSSGINFKSIASKYNGEGLYIRSNTVNKEYPIYYFRGNVDDNNLIFADKCWKIVRTTETGGTKIIYNGTPNYRTSAIEKSDYSIVANDATVPYTFDSSSKKWSSNNHDDSSVSTFEFKVDSTGEYYFDYIASSEGYYDKASLYVDDVLKDNFSGETEGNMYLGELTTNSIIKVTYEKDTSNYIGDDVIYFSLNKKNSNSLPICDNIGDASQIGSATYNGGNSLNQMGYMYSSKTYSTTTASASLLSTANLIFANDVTWDGTKYALSGNTFTSTGTWKNDYSSVTNARRYTCLTSNTSSCSTIYYVVYASSSSAYYITLNDGKNIDDAIEEMLSSDSNVRNVSDSRIKMYIDSWYKNNFDKYTKDYIEDTIWCNEREFNNYAGWDKDLAIGDADATFKSYYQLFTTPSLECSNIADSFSVSSIGNSKLKYPVGLLTADEVAISGITSSAKSYSFLYTGNTYWTMSPYFFRANIYGYGVTNSGKLSGYTPTQHIGVRPAISLNKNVRISSGDGSINDPYKINIVE